MQARDDECNSSAVGNSTLTVIRPEVALTSPEAFEVPGRVASCGR
jgi:hypothetical protein